MIPARIKGKDQGNKTTIHEMAVSTEGAIYVIQAEPLALELPVEVLTRRKLFFDFFRNSSDSEQMTVDGSVTPVEFTIAAEADKVKWVTQVRFLIEGNNFDLTASGDFRRWGSVAVSPGLTNGIELDVVQGGITSSLFYDPVVNMGDLFNYQTSYENFINAIDAQADFLSVDIQLPQPVTLPAGSSDRMFCRINDDLVDPDFLSFRLLAKGYQEVG
jgi:hypothetical protein